MKGPKSRYEFKLNDLKKKSVEKEKYKYNDKNYDDIGENPEEL